MKNTSPLPITQMEGINFLPTKVKGLVKVEVKDSSKIEDLSWDRYVRLNAAATAIKEKADPESSILDVGGFDGAIAFFLPGYNIDLIDPVSTGLDLMDKSTNSPDYDFVTAIDVLEHIIPDQRELALKKLAQMSKKHLVLNYPHTATKEAQKIVWQATGNRLIEEHFKWDLPNTKWVLEVLGKVGFQGKSISHSNLAIWVGQYISLNANPSQAKALNKYLIKNHLNEPFATPLYDLVVASRN